MTRHPPNTQAKEVALLPRHWAWLMAQPRSPSATLRRLVEEARRDTSGRQRIREAQEACYAFLRFNAGDRPNFEAAIRALFAGKEDTFNDAIASWPEDIRQSAAKLASAGWPARPTKNA